MGYRPTPNEMSGYQTMVSPSSEMGLPSRTDKSKDQNYRDRPGVPSNDSYREQALPITPKHEERRDRQMVQQNGPFYNGPPASKDAPDGRNVHKDKVRTPGTPGEEYGHPYLEESMGIKDRRPLQGGLKSPFPHPKQHSQGGEAKRYYQRYYKKHRTEKANDARRRYKKIKNRSDFKLDQRRRKDSPGKFKRKPGGGYRDVADRSRDWREKNPDKVGGVWEGGSFVLTRGNLSQDSENHYDRGMGYSKKRQEWDEQKVPLQNSYPYGFVDNNPGSAKVIPDGHDFANKNARVLKQSAINWNRLSPDKREILLRLIRGPAWREYTQGKLSQSDMVKWLRKNGWGGIDERGFSALLSHAMGMRSAALISEIDSQSGPSLHEKALLLEPKLKRVDPRHGIWTYEVPSASTSDIHTVKVQAFRSGNFRNVDKLDVYVSCSCPYWRWQGPEHHAKVGDYLYGKPVGTASKPVVRDPDGTHGACPHVLAVLGRLKSVVVKKEWKKRGMDKKARPRIVAPGSHLTFGRVEALVRGPAKLLAKYKGQADLIFPKPSDGSDTGVFDAFFRLLGWSGGPSDEGKKTRFLMEQPSTEVFAFIDSSWDCRTINSVGFLASELLFYPRGTPRLRVFFPDEVPCRLNFPDFSKVVSSSIRVKDPSGKEAAIFRGSQRVARRYLRVMQKARRL